MICEWRRQDEEWLKVEKDKHTSHYTCCKITLPRSRDEYLLNMTETIQLLHLQNWSFLSKMMGVHIQHHCIYQNILWWMLRVWSSGMCCCIAGNMSGAIVADEHASSVILGLVECSIFVAVGVGFFNQLKFLCFLLTKSLREYASVVS